MVLVSTQTLVRVVGSILVLTAVTVTWLTWVSVLVAVATEVTEEVTVEVLVISMVFVWRRAFVSAFLCASSRSSLLYQSHWWPPICW